MTDSELISHYLQGSQSAFADLVHRHVNLVYSAARRQVRDPHLAEDVVKQVFIILSRKAASIRNERVLAAWLYNVTRYTALDALKIRARREKYERKAAQMAAHANSAISEVAPSDTNVAWAEIEPVLDDAMSRLSQSDRAILIMRFWESRTPADLAATLGVSDDAVKKRLSRATDRLRKLLAPSAPSMPVTALVPLLISQVITKAPADLAAEVAATALKNAVTAGSAAVTTKGALTLMVALNAKSIAVAAIAILALGGAVYVTKQIITPESTPVPLSSTTTLPPSVATAVAVGAPDGWQTRFNSVYNLKPGEVVKRIEPPYISERRFYFNTYESNNIGEKYSVDFWFTFSWDGKLQRLILSNGKSTVGTALKDGLGIRPYQIEGAANPWAILFPGDLIVLKSATLDQRMEALAPLISAETRRPVRFEKKHVIKNAIVLRGTFHAPRLPDGKPDGIKIYTGSTPPVSRLRNRTYGGNFADGLELQTRLQVINQATPTRDMIIFTTFTTDGVDPDVAQRPADLQSLLDNVARQTSLQMTLEPKETDVWTWING